MAGRVFGNAVHRLGAVISTNDVAFALAEEGAREGTAVVADSQDRGRGRQGRAWISPPGVNIYCSFVLRPTRDRREWTDLPWVMAAAAALLLREEGVDDLVIKCPNDLMAGGRKVAGILLENRQCGSRSKAVVAGIGLNVNMLPEEMPPDIAAVSTSIRSLTGRTADRNALLEKLFMHLDDLYRLWSDRGGRPVMERASAAGVSFAGFEDRNFT